MKRTSKRRHRLDRRIDKLSRIPCVRGVGAGLIGEVIRGEGRRVWNTLDGIPLGTLFWQVELGELRKSSVAYIPSCCHSFPGCSGRVTQQHIHTT